MKVELKTQNSKLKTKEKSDKANKKVVSKPTIKKNSKRVEALKVVSGSAEQALHASGQAAEMFMQNILLPRRVVTQIAEEVAKVVSSRMPVGRRKTRKSNKKVDDAIFLDTSAIIDMRVFDLAKIGVFYGNFIVLESVLTELKNISDSKDTLKRERGRRAMNALDHFKKSKGIKLKVIPDDLSRPVDESIVDHAKAYKARVITCDYNLAKKAKISNVVAIDLYEMTNILKTTALPGEEFYIKIVQEGKGLNQGVGYLPDGTMLVVEQGKSQVGNTVKVEVSRIIQTDAGKILFSKIKSSD